MSVKALVKAAEYALGTLEAIELYGVQSLKHKVLSRTIDKLNEAIKAVKEK